MTTQEVLQACTVDGNTVKLPSIQLERSAYMEVKKRLEGIGGKWKGGKVAGFVFPTCPQQLLSNIQGGEKINLKKDFQFFATPKHIALKMIELAEINPEKQTTLEPSAGHGAITRAFNEVHGDFAIFAYELMEANRMVLAKDPNVIILGDDFLKCDQKFDVIVANPPFNKNQDIDHVLHMFDCLNEGGRIVTIMGTGWQFRSGKKETAFREWALKHVYLTYPLESGTFKESGTMVETVLLVIDK